MKEIQLKKEDMLESVWNDILLELKCIDLTSMKDCVEVNLNVTQVKYKLKAYKNYLEEV